MRIVHRISVTADDKMTLRALAALGVSSEPGLVTFEVDEGDPRWSLVGEFIRKFDALDIVSSQASPAELRRARWLRMEPTWHFGYPQPEGGIASLTATYNLDDYCPQCGIGARQVAPFRFKKEPIWGKKSILQVNWVYDEYFVRPDLWARVFGPFGVDKREVLHHKSGLPLETVVQLRIDTVSKGPLQLGSHPYTHCSRCERRRYEPFVRGFFPRFDQEPSGQSLLKTQEYFGSGASAYRAIVASKHLFQELSEACAKGVKFMPLAD